MLNVFRESIGRYIAIALLALIAVTFIFFGIDFTISRSSFAAKVNGENIPMNEFERELLNTQNEYQQTFRVELTDDLRRELRRSVIEQMITREAMRQHSEALGYRVSDERLAQSIRETEAFQVGGEFSMDVYLARLASINMAPAAYEQLQRDSLSLVEFQNGIDSSTFLTPAEFRRYLELFRERREIAYARFSVEEFMSDVEITDEEIAEHYAANGSRYMTPETVDLEYVELDLPSIARNIEVDEADIRARYESEPERFGTAEERHVQHILIEVQGDDYAAAEAKAEEARERLEAGEDFATLAAEVSDDAGTRNQGGDLGWMTRGMLPGPFEDTLFSMEVGEIAGPVETEFGYHILKLDGIRSGDVASYESVRDELLEEIRNERATDEFYELSNELANAAFEAYDDLQSVADQLGLPLRTVESFSRAGDPDLFPNSTPVVTAAFDEEAIVSGKNSSLIELSDQDVVVIRVTGHHPPEQEPLEAVSDEIREELARTRARELVSSAAGELETALGESPDEAQALAEEHGATWVERHWIERTGSDDPTEIVRVVFAQPKPESGRAIRQRVPLSGGDSALVLVYDVEPGQPEDFSVEEREQLREQLADLAAQAELEAYVRDVRARATVRIPDEVLNPQL